MSVKPEVCWVGCVTLVANFLYHLLCFNTIELLIFWIQFQEIYCCRLQSQASSNLHSNSRMTYFILGYVLIHLVLS